MEHQARFLFIIVFSAITTSCSTTEIISTETISVDTVTPTITYTQTPTKTPTISFTSTPEVDYFKIDIFNESTWPEKNQIFWNSGWLFSKEADRQDFQQFIEKARTAFVAKEGITDEVAKMIEIRPELRSLWGMIYWAATHKDEVIKNKTFVSVTPTELEWIMTDLAASGLTWKNKELYVWKGKIVDQNTQHATYLFESSYDHNDFSSDVLDITIAGKDGLVHVPRGPYTTIFADLGCLAYVGGGESRVNLLLASAVDKNGFYHLAAPAVPLGKDMIITKGSRLLVADGSHQVKFLSEDLNIGQFRDYHEKIYTVEELFKLIGKNMKINFTARAPDNAAAFCLEPKSGNDIALRLQGVFTEGDQDNWPWSL